MKKLSLLHNICFGLAIVSVIGSIITGFLAGRDITWQGISLLWISSALISELRIKELEDKL
jgi:hypothetical protein